MNTIKFVLLMIAVMLMAHSFATAQCPPMPPGFLCISQAAGNQAAANVRELEATKAKVLVLEQALIDKDKNTEEVRQAAQRSIGEVKEALQRTEIQLATKTGELIGAEARITEQRAIIQVLLPNVKKKRNAFITIF